MFWRDVARRKIVQRHTIVPAYAKYKPAAEHIATVDRSVTYGCIHRERKPQSGSRTLQSVIERACLPQRPEVSLCLLRGGIPGAIRCKRWLADLGHDSGDV